MNITDENQKQLHQVTLCFGGLKFAKLELELDKVMSRDKLKRLEGKLLKQLKPTFKGLTRVIVHN